MNSGVHIPEPCHERWDLMQPYGKGRHCASCNKVVVDFTKMKEDEIGSYLMNHPGTCGNVKTIELEKPFGDWRDRLVAGYQYARNSRHHSKKIALLFFSCLLFLSSCYRHVTRGKMRASSDDLKHHSHQKL